MNIAEARSFNDGLEFYSHKNNITLRVIRDSAGNISINKFDYIKDFEKSKFSTKTYFAILLLSILFSLIYTKFQLNYIAFLVFIWIITFAYFFINSKKSNNYMLHKYHAAEHKALNYIDKYGKLPENYFEVMKMSSLSIRCGTTLVAVFYVLITLLVLGISFIPGIILKILWCAFSIYATLYLWANDKCYFFQKMVIKEPSASEVELATIALCEYVKISNNNC